MRIYHFGVFRTGRWCVNVSKENLPLWAPSKESKDVVGWDITVLDHLQPEGPTPPKGTAATIKKGILHVKLQRTSPERTAGLQQEIVRQK